MSKLIVRTPAPSFTPIDNNFIDHYLSDARGDFVKVYIYCLRLAYSGQEASTELISQALNLLQTDIMNALKYWEDTGLMLLSPDGVIEILPYPTPQGDNVITFDNSIKELFESIEKIIGRPLSSKEVHTYMSWIEDFGFTPEMITLLVEYCCSKHKLDIRYMEKVALGWHDTGIQTLDDAMANITRHEEKWIKYRQVLTFMGLKDNDLSKPQEEFLEKWMFKYNYGVDIINEACRICILRINECSFKYIDAIINDWYKNGVKSLQDIKRADKKKPAKKRSTNPPGNYSNQRQYDMAELEKQLLGRGGTNEQ
jgi:DnaD/phage-associated family protein